MKCKCENNFRFSLNHYLHFVDQFQLVPAKEIRPLCSLVNELEPKLASMFRLWVVYEMNAIEEAKREQRRQHVPPASTYQQLVAPTTSRSIIMPSVRAGAVQPSHVGNRTSAFTPYSSTTRNEDLSNENHITPLSTRESSIYYSTTDIPSNTKESSEVGESPPEEVPSQSMMESNSSEDYEGDDEQRKSCSIV